MRASKGKVLEPVSLIEFIRWAEAHDITRDELARAVHTAAGEQADRVSTGTLAGQLQYLIDTLPAYVSELRAVLKKVVYDRSHTTGNVHLDTLTEGQIRSAALAWIMCGEGAEQSPERSIPASTFLEDLADIRQCQSCLFPGGTEPHTCPYAVEMDDHPDRLCNCCDHCKEECSGSR
jgi:hypothetical protein